MPTPLNGLEAKAAFLHECDAAFDRIPMMGQGNSYHALRMEIGLHFDAFPADCPVPEDSEMKFTFVPAAAEYAKQVSKYIDDTDELRKVRDRIDEELAKRVVETQEIIEVDGHTPGKVRETLGLENPDATRPKLFNAPAQQPAQ